MDNYDEYMRRVEAIIGSPDQTNFKDGLEKFFHHLNATLVLPCEVTGIEDFNWEEYYIFGGGDNADYARLKKTNPSYKDRFELVTIKQDARSEWMLVREDIAALCRRKNDEKPFILGLSELKAGDSNSGNSRLLDDYHTWFVNSQWTGME